MLIAPDVLERHIDDWPPLNPTLGKPGHGYVDPHVVETQWKEQFDYAYREYDTFIFPMSIHPQVSGKAHIVLMHERSVYSLRKFYWNFGIDKMQNHRVYQQARGSGMDDHG